MPRVLVDADACPVKDEVYRVAARFDAAVILVANSWMQVPPHPRIELRVVGAGRLDDADDEIASLAGAGDVVVTLDIPLAARALEAGAQAIRPDGRAFDEDSIGSELASRELMASLREAGLASGGPPPFSGRDRSRFLHTLDAALRRAERL